MTWTLFVQLGALIVLTSICVNTVVVDIIEKWKR